MNPHRQTYTEIYHRKASSLGKLLSVCAGLFMLLAAYAYSSWADAQFEPAQPQLVAQLGCSLAP